MVGIKVLIFLFSLITRSRSLTGAFRKEDMAKALDLQRRWLAKGAGYERAEELASCDPVTVSLEKRGITNETRGFHSKHYSECIRHQQVAMCGSETQNELSIVPNSHICDGFIEPLAGYKLCAVEPEKLKSSGPCVVISIGSNNLWEFEENVYKKTNCEVHTFDPREREKHGGIWGGLITVPPAIADRTYFHNYALGAVKKPEVKAITFEEVMTMSNVTSSNPLALFKIDCEGCEWFLFSTLLKQNMTHLLPPQLVMEVHVNSLKYWLARKTIDHYVELFRTLFEAGYTVFENHLGDGGCEVSFVRVSPRLHDYRAHDTLPSVLSALPSVHVESSTAEPPESSSSAAAQAAALGTPHHMPRRGGLEVAYHILMREDASSDAAVLSTTLNDYGVQSEPDLALLDKEHVDLLAKLLKVVPQKKFLRAMASVLSGSAVASGRSAKT